jgi:hypothetical protein
VSTSAISKKPTDALMYSKERMKKCKLFKFMVDTTEPTRDGRFSIWIPRQRIEPRESMKNSVFTSIDHSTSDQDCHSRESLSATVPTMFG